MKRYLERLSILVLMVATVWTTCAPALAQQSDEPVVVEFWHVWDGVRHDLIKEVVRRFEAAHPGIRVEERLIGVAADISEMLTVALAGGVAPDVIMILPGMAMEYGSQQTLLPLEPLAEADGVRIDELIFPVIAESLKWQGNTYSLPVMVDVPAQLYYNRELFDQAGIDSNRGPADHDAFRDAATKLTRRDGADLTAIGINLVGHWLSYHWDNFNAFLGQNGIPLLDDEARVVLPDIAGAHQVLTWMLDFEEQVLGDSAAGMQFVNNNGGMLPAFLNDRLAMITVPNWIYAQIKAGRSDFPLGVDVIPGPVGAEYSGTLAPTWGYAITRDSRNPQAAWSLVRWLAAEVEGGGWFMKQQGRISSIPEMITDPEYFDVAPELWPVVVRQVQLATHASSVVPVPVNVNRIGQAVANAARKQEAPLAALENARRELQAVVDEWWSEQQ